MAKISTYPLIAAPTLNDYVLATDQSDMSATKNISLQALYNLISTTLAPNLVPYTGATSNVNLGLFNLDGQDITAKGVLFSDSISPASLTNVVSISEAGILPTRGLEVDFANNIYRLGDYNGAVNSMSLVVDDNNQFITLGGSAVNILVDEANGFIKFSSPLFTGGGTGTNGQFLRSSGSATPAYWDTVDLKFGDFYSLLNQSVAINTAAAFILENTNVSTTNGVSVQPNGLSDLTRITFSTKGKFNIQLNAKFVRSSGVSLENVNVWIRKNGTTPASNVASSNKKVGVNGSTGDFLVSTNFFVIAAPGDWFEVCYAVSSTDITLSTIASTAISPATPSVSVTVNQVNIE